MPESGNQNIEPDEMLMSAKNLLQLLKQFFTLLWQWLTEPQKNTPTGLNSLELFKCGHRIAHSFFK